MGEVKGLERVQVRFLRKFRRETKPVRQVLKELKVAEATFVSWCGEEGFGRAFRKVTEGVTKDALVDLRVSFALCGRIISGEVMRVLGEVGEKKGVEKKVEVAGEKKKEGDATATATTNANPPTGSGGDDGLTAEEQRLCFEVIKLGMGAFVPKVAARKRRRVFPKVDEGAFARLEKAEG